jgi:hypothetical protein
MDQMRGTLLTAERGERWRGPGGRQQEMKPVRLRAPHHRNNLLILLIYLCAIFEKANRKANIFRGLERTRPQSFRSRTGPKMRLQRRLERIVTFAETPPINPSQCYEVQYLRTGLAGASIPEMLRPCRWRHTRRKGERIRLFARGGWAWMHPVGEW